METQLSICRICRSNSLRAFATEIHDTHSYTLNRCKECGCIQTLEHYVPTSPDYVSLQPEDIDQETLWCQGTHKKEAFDHWWKLTQQFSRNFVPRSCRLLDVGCGTGGFLSFAASVGIANLYGFDSSAAQVSHAARTFPSVRVATSPTDYVRELQQPSLSFELITLWDVLEHVRDQYLMLSQLRTIAARTCCLYISIPNGGALTWKKLLYNALHRQITYIPWEHVYYHTPLSLKIALADADWKVIELGATPCYKRPVNTFELLRRVGFNSLRLTPAVAPQLYALAVPR